LYNGEDIGDKRVGEARKELESSPDRSGRSRNGLKKLRRQERDDPREIILKVHVNLKMTLKKKMNSIIPEKIIMKIVISVRNGIRRVMISIMSRKGEMYARTATGRNSMIVALETELFKTRINEVAEQKLLRLPKLSSAEELVAFEKG